MLRPGGGESVLLPSLREMHALTAGPAGANAVDARSYPSLPGQSVVSPDDRLMGSIHASCGHEIDRVPEHGVWWPDPNGWNYGVLCDACKVTFKAQLEPPEWLCTVTERVVAV